MDRLERLKAWLRSYPHWGEAQLYVDYLDAVPENAGLYPRGLQEVKRTEDVLGNVTVACRYQFRLYRMTGEGQDNAQWLLSFQQWVQQQSAMGLAPRFGDVPAKEQMRAEQGALQEVSQAGTGVYSVILIADFMKVYEVNE